MRKTEGISVTLVLKSLGCRTSCEPGLLVILKIKPLFVYANISSSVP